MVCSLFESTQSAMAKKQGLQAENAQGGNDLIWTKPWNFETHQSGSLVGQPNDPTDPSQAACSFSQQFLGPFGEKEKAHSKNELMGWTSNPGGYVLQNIKLER